MRFGLALNLSGTTSTGDVHLKIEWSIQNWLGGPETAVGIKVAPWCVVTTTIDHTTARRDMFARLPISADFVQI